MTRDATGAPEHGEGVFTDPLLDSLGPLLRDVESFLCQAEEGAFDQDPEDDETMPEWLEIYHGLLSRADRLFWSGDRAGAALAYGPLLDVLGELEAPFDLLPGVLDLPIDIDHHVLQYLRGIYEGIPLGPRAEVLLDAFRNGAALMGTVLTLANLEEAGGGPLPEQEEFLPLWRKELARHRGSSIDGEIAELRTEARVRTAPLESVLRELRRGMQRAPELCLDFARYVGWTRRGDAMAVLEEGLSAIEDPSFRAEVGVTLAMIAAGEDERDLCLTGLREAFRATGRLDLLLRLLDVTEDDRPLRDALLAEERAHLESAGDAGPSRAMVALLAGDLRPALEVVSGEQAWSSGGAAILLPVLLRVAAGGCPAGSCLVEIWNMLLCFRGRIRLMPPRPGDPSLGYFDGDLPAVLPEPGLPLDERLAAVLEERPADEEERHRILGVLREIVTERVRSILREKRVQAYPDAARFAAALAEALALAGRTTEAKRVQTGLLVEFPHHSRFRTDLSRAVARSSVLREGPRPARGARSR
jgi:hypothetical protein